MSKNFAGSNSSAKSFFKKSIISFKKLPGTLKRVVISVPASVLLITILTAIFLSSFSSAYAVSVNGETVGYVTDKSICTKAINQIKNNSEGSNSVALDNINLTPQISSDTSILNEDDLAVAIADEIGDVVKAYGVYKNGEYYYACKNKKDIVSAFKKYVFNNGEGLIDPDFSDDFKIKVGFYDPNTILTYSQFYSQLVDDKSELCGLATIKYKEAVPYKTVETENDYYDIGETVVTQKGKNGLNEITATVRVKHGKREVVKVLSTKVLKKPVIEKIVTGTFDGSKIKLKYPIDKKYKVTSPFGEDRYSYFHMGVDIISPYGTEIYAAADGKIIEAGYSPYGWGNTVLIDHGNGVQTRYAHFSSVTVKVGQMVSKGDLVGLVGMTGDAECNHLHFEVYKNQSRVDPEKYFVK